MNHDALITAAPEREIILTKPQYIFQFLKKRIPGAEIYRVGMDKDVRGHWAAHLSNIGDSEIRALKFWSQKMPKMSLTEILDPVNIQVALDEGKG